MIAPNQWFDDFQKNMSDLLAKTPAADIERNMKALMTQTFARMDLITREEFDVQADLLARALTRVEALEARVQALEQQFDKTA
ncbi:accessory factor UbiK family protein [Castellaniella sp.]|uniref:accessory factor UbiK family protein n=1 Tax=Castellaniella sp. TaxID=1955812 RepID=UPI002AFDE0A4|nr:accessory factor UbiK family protein [Castellaniella sp.]